MNWGGPEFVLLIVGLSTGGWLLNNWIRAKHGYPLEDEWGGKTVLPGKDAEVTTLRAENAELREQVSHFADRVKVLERIVTDKSYTVGSQIEALRNTDMSEGTER